MSTQASASVTDSQPVAQAPDTAVADIYPYGKTRAYYVLGLIILLHLFDFIDRQVVTALFPSLKKEWALSDKQLGLLISTVNWAIAALALPTSMMIDRWSRKNMVGIMAFLWGIASLSCAFAGNYMHLLFLRVLVGAGEAGYAPGAATLLQGYFPQKRLNSVLGIFQSAAPFGALLGVMLGGYIVQHWGWRHAFGVTAIPGIFIALLAFFIIEPKRVGLVKSNAQGETVKISYFANIKNIFTIPSLVCVFFGMTSGLFAAASIKAWMPSYFVRMEGMTAQEASFLTAFTILFSGAGAFLGGIVADKAATKWYNGHLLCTVCYTFLAGAGNLYAFGFAPQSHMYPALLFGMVFINGMLGPSYNTVVRVSHPGARATAVGVMITFQNLLGMGLGIFLGGAMSDFFKNIYRSGSWKVSEQAMLIAKGDPEAAAVAMGLKTSLAAISIGLFIASLLFFIASRHFKKDCENMVKASS